MVNFLLLQGLYGTISKIFCAYFSLLQYSEHLLLILAVTVCSFLSSPLLSLPVSQSKCRTGPSECKNSPRNRETVGRESAWFNLYTRPTDELPATEVGWATVINKSLLLLVWQVQKLVIAPAFYYAALCECLTRALICTRTTFVSSFFPQTNK